MKKNYYEILEVDKNASQEIIKKAYNILVKKYHPDLQEGNLKQIYEEKIKIINEAYDVISNKEKREIYDLKLNEERLKEEEFKLNKIREQEYNNFHSSFEQTQKNNYTQESADFRPQNNQINNDYYYQEQIRQAQNKAYYDAYIQDLKNRGYKFKYKKTLKEHFKDFIALLITIFILLLLWQLPFVQNFFKDNILIRTLFNT